MIRVSDLPDKGFEPLAFRYLALTAHYRSKLDFTEEAMHAAASGLRRLRRAAGEADDADASAVDLAAEPMAGYRARFVDAIATTWACPPPWRSPTPWLAPMTSTRPQRRALLLDFDRVLGLGLDAPAEEAITELPEDAAALLEQRAAARAARDFATSDRLRDELAALGVEVRDTPERPGDDRPPLSTTKGATLPAAPSMRFGRRQQDHGNCRNVPSSPSR